MLDHIAAETEIEVVVGKRNGTQVAVYILEARKHFLVPVGPLPPQGRQSVFVRIKGLEIVVNGMITMRRNPEIRHPGLCSRSKLPHEGVENSLPEPVD